MRVRSGQAVRSRAAHRLRNLDVEEVGQRGPDRRLHGAATWRCPFQRLPSIPLASLPMPGTPLVAKFSRPTRWCRAHCRGSARSRHDHKNSTPPALVTEAQRPLWHKPPPESGEIAAIYEVDSDYWFDGDRERATVRGIVDHVRLIEQVEVKYPSTFLRSRLRSRKSSGSPSGCDTATRPQRRTRSHRTLR